MYDSLLFCLGPTVCPPACTCPNEAHALNAFLCLAVSRVGVFRQMEVVSLPRSMAMGIAKDVSDGGVIVSRALAVMDVTVMGG